MWLTFYFFLYKKYIMKIYVTIVTKTNKTNYLISFKLHYICVINVYENILFPWPYSILIFFTEYVIQMHTLINKPLSNLWSIAYIKYISMLNKCLLDLGVIQMHSQSWITGDITGCILVELPNLLSCKYGPWFWVFWPNTN